MQTISDADLQQLTTQVAMFLLEHDWMLSSAESCTGGWLAKCCTDIAGSSIWFERGVVSYSNQSKQDFLDVQLQTLNQFGAVSEQTVIEMAQGILAHSNADISVAITGIAGPDGGSNDKPVGMVWFAWAVKNATCIAQCHYFEGDRETIRRKAVFVALNGIIKNARD
ncbi:MAG: damage-inducible protein CinA [Gammaproteobacteria bacterium]|nr:MAG: damage-inducible protein CinA [Gammaproteobacteria bacterium]